MPETYNVTKRELAIYYALRKRTFKMGISDKMMPRPRIPKNQPLSHISRSRFEACLEAEMDVIDLALKYVAFEQGAKVARQIGEAEYWRDEALSAREQIRSLRTNLGLEPDDG